MKYLIEGPFESDYSLAIVNRKLAYAVIQRGVDVVLHQRDNTTDYEMSEEFKRTHPELASRAADLRGGFWTDIHTRYIFPPHTDRMYGEFNGAHCYGWEESVFPAEYTGWMNDRLDFVTTMSDYTRQVLQNSGVKVPVFNVGLGADHILSAPAVPFAGFHPQGTFDFLHVSSCFPRKGVDVLIQAFCGAFDQSHNVRLVIKTFPNPHNQIHQLIAAADAEYPGHAPVLVIEAPMSVPQMRWLYENTSCLIAPSRGEGFGLPVTEAMLLRKPVIATPYSGHTEFCNDETCWPIAYRITRASTHLSEGDSVWAEPDVLSLQEQMEIVRRASTEQLRGRLDAAESLVAQRFTWEKVAGRQLEAMEEVRRAAAPVVVARRKEEPGSQAVGIITSWNSRCGIAEYTRYIVSSFAGQGLKYRIFASEADALVREDEEYVSRSWAQGYSPPSSFRQLIDETLASGVDLVSVQYNYGFFHAPVLDYLIKKLHANGVRVAVTMHAVRPPLFPQIKESLSQADLVVVHREEDREFLLSQGLERISLLPMGNPVPRSPVEHSQKEWFVVSSFGFLLPFKGIYELIAAFAAAVRVNPRMRLDLSTALYPIYFSPMYANTCKALIDRFHLGSRVTLDTRFLDDDAVLDRLSKSDLVVLPYIHSTESASAAIRLPLSSMRPVLCSDLPVFQDAADVVHFYPAGDTAALARRILEFSARPAELRSKENAQRDFTERLSWPRISAMYAEQCLEVIRRRSSADNGPVTNSSTLAVTGQR